MDSSHNRGWIFRSGGTNYASVSARGEAYFNSVGTDNYIAYPSGGFFSSNGSTGYIIITIPANYRSCTMMRFNVEIYNYSTGTSTTYTIGGYNYSDGNWYNVFAYANRQGTTGYGNLTVRFGHNGTNSIIWIGESNTSYSYPKVRITNVTLGHSAADYNTWAAGWSVTIATTAPTNVSQTVTNPATNYYAESAGSAGNADTVDGQHFNWNNNKNDHTYLWAASSNGQAYLVHRASMSVNYANSAGSARQLTSLGNYTYSNLSKDIPTNAVSYKIVASGGAVLGDSQYNVLHIPWSSGDYGTYLLFGANNGRFGIKYKHTGDVRELPTILTTSSSNVTSLDCKKYSSIYVTRSSTQTMTLSTTPNEGMECHIVIYNSGSSNITITLPSSYRKNITSITIAPGAFGEVNVMTINSIVHVRAV